MTINADPPASYALMYFDYPARALLIAEYLATDKVEYPISGDALARIRAAARAKR